VATLPSLQTNSPAPVQEAPPSAPAPHPADPVKKNVQSQPNTDQTTDQVNGETQAAGSTSAQAQAAPPSSDAQSTQQTNSAAAIQGQAGTPAPEAGAKTAAVDGSSGNGSQAAGKLAQAQASVALADAPAAPAAPATSSAASVQDAMGQAYPGGKFQVQYGDEGTATTTKAPLTEFVNQIPMEAKSDGEAQGGSLPDPSAAAQTAAQMAATAQTDAAAQLAAALPAAALDGAGALQTLQTPLAATTALLAPASPQTAPTAITAAAGNQAAASALGAGALPGASGSVRVTAPAASEASLPAEDQSLLSQVDGSIRWLVKNQDKGAELQLHPESLGRVQISIKVEGSVVHAKVWASEASTVPVLQDHKAMLEASLKQQGLTLGSFDLQHGRKDQQASLPAPAETPVVSTGGQNLAQAGTETAALTPAAAIRTSRIEYVA